MSIIFDGGILRMRRIIAFLFAAAFFGSSVFAQRVPIKNVAVVETQIDESSGAASEINRAEIREITGEIRRAAVNNLPRGRFNVMTTETVQSMGDAVLEECAEENCVIALGSKIGADYIVRGIISKFRQNITLSVEMYETEYGMLVATADPVRTVNVDELLEKSTAVCAAMYKKFLESSSPAASQTAAAPPVVEVPPPAVVTPPPVNYKLTVSALPSAGGSVWRSPNQTNYTSGTVVTVTAAPANGYTFMGWSGAAEDKSDRITVTMDANKTLTANFLRQQREKAAPAVPRTVDDVMTDGRKRTESKPEESKKKSSPLKLTMRISTAALAAGGFIGGAVYEGKVKSEYEKYENTESSWEAQEARKNTEDFRSTGNVFYTLGWIGLSAFTLSLFF